MTFGLLEAFSYIKWPDSLALSGKYSEVLQLNIFQIAPIHRLFPYLEVDAFGSLFAILSMNAIAVIVAFVVYCLTRIFVMHSNTLNEEDKVKKISQTKILICRDLFFFLYVTYLSTCSKTSNVLPLACRTLYLDEHKESRKKFLKADYNFQCTGAQYNRLVVIAYCAILYIIFLPAASLVALWGQKRALSKKESEAINGECDATEEPRTEVAPF